VSANVKPNFFYLLVIAILLFLLLTIFDRTFASEFVGRSLGFGLGLLIYPPTALPLLVYSWFVRRWNLLGATILASVPFLLFMYLGRRGFILPGETFTWAMAIFGLLVGLSIGIAVLQLSFFAIGKVLSRSARRDQ
jgi:hypothetical protein